MENEFLITTISRRQIQNITKDARVADLTDLQMESFAMRLEQLYRDEFFEADVCNVWQEEFAPAKLSGNLNSLI